MAKKLKSKVTFKKILRKTPQVKITIKKQIKKPVTKHFKEVVEEMKEDLFFKF